MLRKIKLKKPIKFFRIVIDDPLIEKEFFIFKARRDLWIVLSKEEIDHGFYDDDVLVIKAKNIDELVTSLWILLLKDNYDEEEINSTGLAYVEEYNVLHYLKL